MNHAALVNHIKPAIPVLENHAQIVNAKQSAPPDRKCATAVALISNQIKTIVADVVKNTNALTVRNVIMVNAERIAVKTK